jgi:hypothetical protein
MGAFYNGFSNMMDAPRAFVRLPACTIRRLVGCGWRTSARCDRRRLSLAMRCRSPRAARLAYHHFSDLGTVFQEPYGTIHGVHLEDTYKVLISPINNVTTGMRT